MAKSYSPQLINSTEFTLLDETFLIHRSPTWVLGDDNIQFNRFAASFELLSIQQTVIDENLFSV